MSRLFHSEKGYVFHRLNEEISSRRWARKILQLPAQAAGAGTLYLYGRAHPGYSHPLRVSVNGHPFTVPHAKVDILCWMSLALEPGVLRPGANEIVVSSANAAMDSWVLGIDPTVPNTGSSLSLDGGRTWQRRPLSMAHCLDGEYVIRVRLDAPALADPPPAPPTWPAPRSEFLEEIRAVVPADIQAIPDPWDRACALKTWVSCQWTYNYLGADYAPWDPLTILSWGKSGFGHSTTEPTVMCVHYGIVFVCAALALGIPARSLCTASEVNSWCGHFVNEVWSERWNKWCHVDPNADLVYLKNGVPLATAELAREGARLRQLAVIGPGYATQPALVRETVETEILIGLPFRLWAVWPHGDRYGHPERCPPSHGHDCYADTDWVWADTPDQPAPPMFPCHASPEALQAPPPTEWRNLLRPASKPGR